MKRLWSADELGERWTLSAGDLAFVDGNADAGKLGLTYHSYFPAFGRCWVSSGALLLY